MYTLDAGALADNLFSSNIAARCQGSALSPEGMNGTRSTCLSLPS